ncbi:MAG: Holliday junction branch migration DNA helicase RuvB, partial [Synechococcaceae bacterium WB5_2B_268]|nr:Holliday junction branch migration DNA helicase RuvB [Synechococcaceae bacterium WB5_2B_268]
MAIQSSSGNSPKKETPRLMAAEASGVERDGGRDEGLRPKRLCDYVGQPELKQVLAIALEA